MIKLMSRGRSIRRASLSWRLSCCVLFLEVASFWFGSRGRGGLTSYKHIRRRGLA